METASSHRPLEGTTVVAVEQAVAGPYATRQLADLGARVIKIERPDGGDFSRQYDEAVKGMSSWFVWLNRSKESLTLDLKRPESRLVMGRLLQDADVFLQNLAPGAADRLGLAPSALRESYPGLIVCNISGYGSSGPYAGRKAYDLIVQSEVGMLSITGTPAEPCKAGVSVADISAGMYACSAILAALLERGRTGRGRVVDVALFDTLGEWMGYAMYYTAYGGAPPVRTGAAHATIAPYGPFRTRDGLLVLAVQNDREWARFCEMVLGDPFLAADERFRTNTLRIQNRAALEERIAKVMGERSFEEAVELLDASGIAYARLNGVGEFLEHPQLDGRDCWREVDSPVGRLRALRPPVRMEGFEPAMGAVPALGQHTEPLLRELGFDAGTVERWQQTGVV